MSLLADRIEQLILKKLLEEKEENVILRRNELAGELDCAPSQISYVLSTRFSNDKGFVVESRRGLGGFISITRIRPKSQTSRSLVTIAPALPMTQSLPKPVPFKEGVPRSIQEVDRWIGVLLYKELISHREARLMHDAFDVIFKFTPDVFVAASVNHLYDSIVDEIGGE